MKKLICNFSLFKFNQTIFLVDSETEERVRVGDATVDGLPSTLLALCRKYNVNSIHLYGTDNYLAEIASNIYSCNAREYHNNNLKVEVN